MTSPATVLACPAESTQGIPPLLAAMRSVQELPARLAPLDEYRRAYLRLWAARGWRSIRAKQARVARALGVSESTISRRADGLHASSLSRVCEDAYQLSRAGLETAWITATIETAAMRARLEHLTDEDLRRRQEEMEVELAAVQAEIARLELDAKRGREDRSAKTLAYQRLAMYCHEASAVLGILQDREQRAA